MTNLMNRIAGLTGLMVLTGAAAFAQSEMKVEVPFTFHTPTATMAPGTYTFTNMLTSTSTPIYRLRNADTKKTVLVVAPTVVGRKWNDTTDAKVVFKCVGEYCALATIYSPSAPSGHALSVDLKEAPAGEKIASVVIPAKR